MSGLPSGSILLFLVDADTSMTNCVQQTHVRETSGLYLLLANEGVHNEHVESTVMHLSDVVVDLSTEPFGSEDYARKMRVLKMPGAFTDMKVYAYRVGSAGIEMAALHRVR